MSESTTNEEVAQGEDVTLPARSEELWSLLALATGAAARTRGLLCTSPHDGALLLVPCNDIHTVGMRYELDVAFVDRAGFVVEAHRALGPQQRRRSKNAAAVIERFASDKPWFHAGDRIGLACVRVGQGEVCKAEGGAW